MAAPEPARVLFVTSNFPRWVGDSTTAFVLHLAQDLRALGCEVDVLAPHAEGAARREVLDGVPVRRFRYLLPERAQRVCYRGGALINLERSPATALQLPALVGAELMATTRLLRSGGYGIVHSHWVLPQGLVAELARRGANTGAAHLVTAHGGDVFGLQAAPLQQLKGWAFERADAVTANSTATERRVRELAPGVRRLHRIPIGAAVDRTPDRSCAAALRAAHRRPGGPLVGYVGRIIADKGVEDVVETVARLVTVHPDVTGVLVGSGQDSDRVAALAGRLGVSDRVRLAGWVDPARVPDWLAACDVVLAPSRIGAGGWTEALGLAIIEALAAGRPVVATAVGGIPDVVTDGVTGLLVPQRDPAALAAAVHRLCVDPDLAARLGSAGRVDVVARFSRRASAQKFAAVYAELLAG